ncbi:MAG: CHAT domain-containing protein [Chloroflexi bacterium]|nr:CHAT domain-containing protein [Chloroflexota bacterium]
MVVDACGRGQPRFELIQLPAPITLARLETALRDGVHILHLVGHGQMSRSGDHALLYLADENNQVQPVRDSEFVAMLTRLLGGVDTVATANLRLVYLSSCQTASRNPADAFRGLAPQLVRAGITSVVAMQDLVPVVTAQAFARTFYEQLAQHGQVDAAANRARAHILTSKLPGEAIPVLFSRLRSNRLLHDPLASEAEREAGLVMTINSEGGDVIAGDKHIHGAEVHGDKVGGDKVEGDKITVGNITGSQGIAIGRGARANVRIQYGPAGNELAALFAPLLAQAARENVTAVAQLQALKAEVAKGENADDDNMADLIGDIARAAPAVVEGLVNLFINTVISKVAGGATKYVLRRLRKDVYDN